MTKKAQTKATILFVDDEAIIRKSLARELHMENFAVTTAAGGKEAIAVLNQRPFDLVITDLMMPEVDGFSVLKAAKKLAPMTGVIILTGYGDMHSAIDALRLGADDFALKPCESEELTFRIRRCLDKRNLLLELSAQNQRQEEEIEQRRLVEQQLVESENRFRMALDASSNGVWDHNLLTGSVYVGENWHRTLGYANETEVSDEQFFANMLHPDDRERVHSLRQAHILGATPCYEAEYRMKNKVGGWQWILSRGQVIERNEQGHALRIIGTHSDITRVKEAEAELNQSRAKLEQRVKTRTAELSDSNTALTVLLKKREDDQTTQAEQVLATATKLVEPLLNRLKETELTEQQQVLVEIIESNVNELTSPFANNFSTKLARLTPAEIQVASMIKLGKNTQEIAAIMHLAPGTISIHRKNIRKKLELTHQKTNLQSILSLHS